ncbi:MAG: YbhB/YbcL family Raf kinase inhibitor-like protein [Chloroflexi bacterium]|nr:YbhB/YbcL family Raf kinase inhibitor-like protein [Chloroflexota bacterium]
MKRKLTKWLCAVMLVVVLTACVQAPVTIATSTQVPDTENTPKATAAMPDPTEAAMPFELTSPSFEEDGLIPRYFACTGTNQSPELNWNDPPTGAQSFALVFDDPDAASGSWVHWVMFNVPAESRGLAAGISPSATFEDGTIQGTNSWGRLGYGGPCPPEGSTHRYVFILYALDAVLDLSPEAMKEDLLAAMDGHVLAEAKLSASFGR